MTMYFRNFSYLTLVSVLCLVLGEGDFQLPSYWKVCSKSSPDFNRCMINNQEALMPDIINGNETLQIPNMNPLTVEKINIKQGNKQIGLGMNVRDVKVFGLDTLKIKELDLNMDSKTLSTRFVISRLEMLGYHKTSGNIMVVKMQGEGKFNITVENVDMSYQNTFDYVDRPDGHTYAIAQTQKLKMNSVNKMIFNLENMLGDTKLDTAINDLLNQYWRELSADLFEEMSDELLEISKIIINIILGVFPVDMVTSP